MSKNILLLNTTIATAYPSVFRLSAPITAAEARSLVAIDPPTDRAAEVRRQRIAGRERLDTLRE